MRRSGKINKRGIIGEVAVIMGILFICSVLFIVGKVAIDRISDKLAASPEIPAEANTVMSEMSNKFSILDDTMIFIVIALTIGLVVTSFLIPSHPVFIVINIIGLFFLVLIAFVLSNTQNIIAENPALINASAEFSNTNLIMNNLPWICVAIVFLASIVNFARGQIEGGG